MSSRLCRKRELGLALLVAGWVLACSGGSGGSGGGGGGPDGGGGGGGVAPTITSQPAAQSITVGQTATFSVTASGTAPLAYAWQRNGSAIAGASASTYTTPAAVATDDGADYRVVVSNAAGSVTSAPAALSVAVLPPPSVWGTPVLIQPDLSPPTLEVSPLHARVVMDPQGRAIAIWTATEVESGDPVFTTHASRYTPATGWSPHARIDIGPKSFSQPEAEIAVDGSGNAIAAWTQSGGPLTTAVYDATLGWQAPTALDAPNEPQGLAALAITPDGHAFLAYRGSNSDGIYVNRYVPGTGWDARHPLKDLVYAQGVDSAPGGFATVAVNANGVAVVVWRDPDGFAYAARYVNGWQPVEKLGETFGEVLQPSKGLLHWDYAPCAAAVDPQGNMTVLWQDDDGYNVSKMMSSQHLAIGGGWSTPVDLDPTGDPVHNLVPHIGVDAAGRMIATWQKRFAAGHDEVWSTKKAAGGDWEAASLVGPLEGTGATALAVSADGSATLVYPESGLLLSSRTYLPGSGWGPATPFDVTPGRTEANNGNGSRLDMYFDVAMDAHGHAAAVWTHEHPIFSPQFLVPNSVWAATTQ